MTVQYTVTVRSPFWGLTHAAYRPAAQRRAHYVIHVQQRTYITKRNN